MTQRQGLVLSAILLFLGSLYLNLFLKRSEAYVPREPLASFPASISGWESRDREFPTEILKNLGVDDYIMRRYAKGEKSIWLYIGYYRNQKEGAMPHSPRHCYPGSGFNPVRKETIAIPVTGPGGRKIFVNRYVFARGPEREVVVYWYQSRGRVIADEYLEKAYLIRDAIFRNRGDGALVRFSTRATSDSQEEAEKTLVDFITDAYPRIPRVVPD